MSRVPLTEFATNNRPRFASTARWSRPPAGPLRAIVWTRSRGGGSAAATEGVSMAVIEPANAQEHAAMLSDRMLMVRHSSLRFEGLRQEGEDPGGRVPTGFAVALAEPVAAGRPVVDLGLEVLAPGFQGVDQPFRVELHRDGAVKRRRQDEKGRFDLVHVGQGRGLDL